MPPVADPLAGLNPEQHRAARTLEGPLLVLAGAGTGKTRVVTVRIAHLLQRGVAPGSVLAVTFTNKAAREMKDRIAQLVGRRAAGALTVGTFHAFCARALREHGEAIGLPPTFTIADASDQIGAVKSVMRELKVADAPVRPATVQAALSLHKNRLVSPEDALAEAADDAEELVARVYARYEEHLARARTLDFDDLLVQTCRLLSEAAGVRETFAARYRYLMVDEYQDTNGPQYEIVRALAAGHRNLCVVGDDDQSIYGWRGADVQKILGFETDFPDAVVVRLETNYRSTGPILEAANRVIAHNRARHEKRLRPAVEGGDEPAVHRLEDEMEEASFVVRRIVGLARRGEARPGDVAVLFRTQQQPRPLEAELRKARLPYVLVGGMSFFDRKEVRDVLAYLRLLVNRDDEASLLRVVNRPPRGIGKGSIDKVLALATERSVSVTTALAAAAEEGILGRAACEGASDLLALLDRFGASDPGHGLVQHLGRLLEEAAYRAEVERAHPDARTRRDRWQAVLEVLDLAENYLARAADPSLSDFLERLALATNDDPTPEDASRRDAVTLMTLHAAKGLEFPHVILVGVEEGLLPHARSVAEDSIEEERRLMYVGITRARRGLDICWAASRSRWGHRGPSMPSRFLFEMTGTEPPPDWRPAGAEARLPAGPASDPAGEAPGTSSGRCPRRSARRTAAAGGEGTGRRRRTRGGAPDRRRS